jgi:hypothetical protein
MEYKIEGNEFTDSYTKNEVQGLIDDQKISDQTRIWKAEWGKWKKIKDTDFDLTICKRGNSSYRFRFFSVKPFLNNIDNGKLFRKPFSWLYVFLGILSFILPFKFLFDGIENNIFDYPFKFSVVFILDFVIILFSSWFWFQIWWDRKSRVVSTSREGDEFVATPILSHFIQTLGESVGTSIIILGFLIPLFTEIILGEESNYLESIINIQYISFGFKSVIISPILGFLIILVSRFLAEQFRALSSIANNTYKERN